MVDPQVGARGREDEPIQIEGWAAPKCSPTRPHEARSWADIGSRIRLGPRNPTPSHQTALVAPMLPCPKPSSRLTPEDVSPR